MKKFVCLRRHYRKKSIQKKSIYEREVSRNVHNSHQHTHTHTHTRARAHKHTHKHARAHTRTHTLAQMFSLQ